MLRKIFSYFTLPLLLLLSNSSGNSAPQSIQKNQGGETGTLEKLIVANGSVAMDLDLNRLTGSGSGTQKAKLENVRFEVGPNSFFTVLVFNDVLRGPDAGSMGLIWGNSRLLPEPLNASANQLVIEKLPSDAAFELAVRDEKTGFVFFNIEGHQYEYAAAARSLGIRDGRLLISQELANKLGRPADAGAFAGKISVTATMYPIEVTTLVNNEVQSAVLPARSGGTPNVPTAVPGPDVIVGDLPAVTQAGATGTRVGLGVGTTSCNNGDQNLNWFALPNTDHPVIPQNLYRMSGGATNDDRFEQIGQSWMKHAFTALTENICGFGCNGTGGTHLGVGCSDPYSSSLNATQSRLGSRAWVHPFTGAYPSTAADHTGHNDSSSAATHRLLVEGSDLNTTLNPGATYYAEAQYVTPHEYAWCQAHAGQCNMYNNASYRRFNVTGTTSFTFGAVGSTFRTTPAINAWTGATINTIEPEPGVDGRGFVAYKVTNPSAGVWHYEYAVNNQNLDRGIQSFSVPLGNGITVSNLGFHAPPNHPGIANDGTVGSAGYSNVAWTSNQTASDLSWSSETFAQNQNANALRWGTLYNFRFDSNRPPQATNATIGFYKTGAPITVGIQGPAPDGSVTPSPTPTPPNPTPTPTPTPPIPTPTPSATATPTPTIIPIDLAVGITDSPDPVQVGQNLTYTIIVANNGPGNPTNVMMTDTLPASVNFVSANPSQGSCSGTSAVTCNLGSLPAFGSATVTLVVTPTADGPLSNTAIAPNPGDPFPSNNSATASTTVLPVATPTPTPPTTPTPTPTITPTPPPAAQSVNLSTRMRVQTGEGVGIGGFIITGSAPKHILLRAIGPSLAQSGVPNVLADPVIELHGPGGFATVTNDNWRDDPVQEAAIIATGIPPSSNLEAAIDTTLLPGAYTAIVSGKNNTSGVALIEVYDLSPAVPAKLANISTRASVGTGSEIVIAGFILGGNNSGNDEVILRGLGGAGVANPLLDPTLELRDANGALIGSDNDWQDDAATAAGLSSLGLAPPHTLDAAIMATLPPGLYTALLAGRNNSTGIGLVEVYDLGAP